MFFGYVFCICYGFVFKLVYGGLGQFPMVVAQPSPYYLGQRNSGIPNLVSFLAEQGIPLFLLHASQIYPLPNQLAYKGETFAKYSKSLASTPTKEIVDFFTFINIHVAT